MKKQLLTSLFALTSVCVFAQNPNDVKLMPDAATVCHQTNLYISIAGNSFTPVSYQWSNGATTPTISVTASGTYTVTMTGVVGNSNKLRTVVKTNYYNVLPKPGITQLTNAWVCKDDTVKLLAEPGYNTYQWNTGTTGSYFAKAMTKAGGNTPSLDTLTVYYTSGITGVCSVVSDELLIRGVRKPKGVGQYYCGKTDLSLTDSVAAGLVLEYLYPVSYDMQFTDINDPTNVVNYTTQPGQLKAPTSILEAGKTYSVITRPIIGPWTFCYGDPCIIGITASGNRLSSSYVSTEGIKTFRVMDLSGRILTENKGEQFNNEWLTGLGRQLFVVSEISNDGHVNSRMISFTE